MRVRIEALDGAAEGGAEVIEWVPNWQIYLGCDETHFESEAESLREAGEKYQLKRTPSMD